MRHLKNQIGAEILSEEYLVAWHKGDAKVNRKSSIYQRKQQKVLKEIAEPFIKWLK